uniref:PILR alpha associated neural protein n=1 Tax=Latimeria chalumnae TaxID=7897 RepID=H3ASU2_LATCH
PPPLYSPLPRRRKRQVPGDPPEVRASTPSFLGNKHSSSQYPWAIVWGPTVPDEETPDSSFTDTSSIPQQAEKGPKNITSRGPATPFPNAGTSLQENGINLGETPATLQPFLFRHRTGDVDPQLYVTITISGIIVLVASAVIIKFCWDRNQKRREGSEGRSALQQEDSHQGLTDVSPSSGTVFSTYSRSPVNTPDPEEPEPTTSPHTGEKPSSTVKNAPFQRNRIPLVNL